MSHHQQAAALCACRYRRSVTERGPAVGAVYRHRLDFAHSFLTRVPSVSMDTAVVVHSIPRDAYASRMAIATRSARAGSSTTAKTVGPAPEIDEPRAPAFRAAAFASGKPGMRLARA